MTRIRMASCLAIAIVAVAGQLPAQDSLASGRAVRVTAQSRGLDHEAGILVAARDDSIIVRFGSRGAEAVPTPAVTLLETRVPGANEAGPGLLVGLVGGTLVGYALGNALDKPPAATAACSGLFCGKNTMRYGGAAGGLLLGAVGAVVGVIVGTNTPVWGPAPGWHVSPRVSVDRGRPGLGLSVSF